ncbi:hypothetical protein [Mangrovibacterium diazotrophicum]|uniref:Uncharacterized protein n=1 Tax=Mangrovibacterium diazotrophicum TaxID=1261403 RepID=A0A419VXD8_9BACT|nr:hypothetical protein [Mangrovibacterium diazotrophicum]RKD87866.1 hypothetical protein BC643_3873 [Mangrovibacterium diazotrophicum]
MNHTEKHIPEPFRFNAFKHHRNFQLMALADASEELIDQQLAPVCNNYVDVYTGVLSPADICAEIEMLLKKICVFEKDEFTGWLRSNRGYQELRLSDDSQWIVREGIDSVCYIHIHPARTGAHHIRYKGSTLKTVFLLKMAGFEAPQLEDVNRLRQQVGLSPVARLAAKKGILKCFQEFFR